MMKTFKPHGILDRRLIQGVLFRLGKVPKVKKWRDSKELNTPEVSLSSEIDLHGQ